MKKVLIIILLALMLVSCQNYREYSIEYERAIPDSSLVEYRDMIETLVGSSNPANLTTNRSKDFGQIIEAAERVSFKTYCVNKEKLRIKTVRNSNWISTEYVGINQLTPELQVWYDKCKTSQKFIKGKI